MHIQTMYSMTVCTVTVLGKKILCLVHVWFISAAYVCTKDFPRGVHDSVSKRILKTKVNYVFSFYHLHGTIYIRDYIMTLHAYLNLYLYLEYPYMCL